MNSSHNKTKKMSASYVQTISGSDDKLKLMDSATAQLPFFTMKPGFSFNVSLWTMRITNPGPGK